MAARYSRAFLTVSANFSRSASGNGTDMPTTESSWTTMAFTSP